MGHAFELGMQADQAIIAHGEGDLVAVVEELEQGLQLVIAVIATSQDMQHQVELGRGGQGQRLRGHVIAPACVVAIP